MKKRTVITTEKHEVWVISEGGVKRELTDQPQSDIPGPELDSLIPTEQVDSDTLPTQDPEEGNE